MNSKSRWVGDYLSPKGFAALAAYHLLGWSEEKLKEELGEEWESFRLFLKDIGRDELD